MHSRSVLAALAAAAALAGSAVPAHASLLLDRDTRYESIKVAYIGTQQVAEVTYLRAGAVRHVLVWGAINARNPSPTTPQVRFRVNYSGGYGSFRWGSSTWSYIARHNVCHRAALGLAAAVAQCTITAGSGKGQHWALQKWQRDLPNMGVRPSTGLESAQELHVSHWNGQPATLWLKWDWSYPASMYPHLYGALSYHGVAVYGFSSTSTGNPLDGYGRNIYTDLQTTHWNTAWSPGGHWYRFNSFLSHKSRGDFCATVFPSFPWLPHVTRNPFGATAYRATVVGPGVTPDVRWQGPAPTATSTPYTAGGFVGGVYLKGLTLPLAPAVSTAQTQSWTALNDEQIAIAGGPGSSDKCATVYGPH